MWRLYFYGEPATDEVCNLRDLARYVMAFAVPDDLEWFEMAPIEWDAVNRGYVWRQFTGSVSKPNLTLVVERMSPLRLV